MLSFEGGSTDLPQRPDRLRERRAERTEDSQQLRFADTAEDERGRFGRVGGWCSDRGGVAKAKQSGGWGGRWRRGWRMLSSLSQSRDL